MWYLKNVMWPQRIQHHHEVAPMMNFHLQGAQNRSHSSGLGQDRSEVRSRKKNPQALFQTQNSRCSAKHSFVSGLWCQNRHHTCDWDDHTAEVTDNKDGATNGGAYLLGWERRSSSPLPDSCKRRDWQNYDKRREKVRRHEAGDKRGLWAARCCITLIKSSKIALNLLEVLH